ncbi:pyridoxal phosphate-dependent aminotransferase family protein [Flavobacterium circumlabens]|uniref:7-keto-8-aminopelargonate synthetase-like enzyme n=1 Tax=Flavobacterium circumlabens TaxID=2133765 RepID=A0A4Y7UBQ8_9FLAO|nr:aminotransferase class I/II-fold pyridoxal phosphate-dependent enzyme [Flavobacterium circumlabens]TCN57543.1 7-keto-8-aminopelargonate synthetase-like enzyme [Flavobacterium circumlabens]TEB43855.1 pyridoxal phosphate-dependent aminotransferase family protein [Flavobacterium circumlabens]
MKVSQFPDRIIEIDQEQYLYFGGTAYLGLSVHKEFQQLVLKNILRWGTTYGSSRNANVKVTAYDDGESFLAQHIKAESAVTVSSGMLAGKMVIEELNKETDCYFHFPNAHPAIKAHDSLPFFEAGKINPRLFNPKPERITILTDAVPSYQTKAVDLLVLKEIPNHKEITLVIDESHSLGILGQNGCGIYNEIQFPVKRKIMVSSLGKAFGLTGGVIAGDLNFINQIKNLDIFISAAGMNPAFVQTLAEAAEIYPIQHQKLVKNLEYLDSKLIKNENIKFDKTYPLIYIEIESITEILKANKIIIANFRYQENAKDINRIVVTANHLKEDLDKLVNILNACNSK